MSYSSYVIGSRAGILDIGLIRDALFRQTVYVDPINGRGQYDGLEPLPGGISLNAPDKGPLQSIQQVYDRFPMEMLDGARLNIRLAGIGGFTTPTERLDYDIKTLWLGGKSEACISSYRYIGPPLVPYTLNVGAQTAVVTGKAQVVFPVGHRTRLDFAAPGWVANALRGMVRITRNGLLVIPETAICDNTANQLFLDWEGFFPMINVGDTVEIVRPGIRFMSSDVQAVNSVTIKGSGGPYWNLANVNGHPFTRCGFASIFVCGVYGVGMDRCWIEGESNWQGGSIFFVNSYAYKPPDNALLGQSAILVQGGCSTVHDQAGSEPDSPTNPINQGNDVGTEIITHECSFIVGHRMGGMSAQYLTQRNCSFYANASAGKSGLVVEGPGSIFYVQQPPENGNRLNALQGARNAEYGINARFDGAVRVNPDNGATPVANTLTGTIAGNDLFLGSGLPITWAELNNAAMWNGLFSHHLNSAGGFPRGLLSRIYTYPA